MPSTPPRTDPAESFVFRPRVFELPPEVDLPRALERLSRRERPAVLDSAAGEPRRFGLVAFDPVLCLPRDARSLGDLRAFTRRLVAAPGDEVPGPFHGGFVGALSYDLGAAGEVPVDCAPEPWDFPLLVGGLYTDFVLRDEVGERTWLVLGEEPGDGRPAVQERRAAITAQLLAPRAARDATGTAMPGAAGPLVRHVPAAEHRRRIERVRAHIAAGDVYQVNLAHRFTAAVTGEPSELYARLRAVNPAPYMGYMEWGAGALLSASPELLLEFDGVEARTRPIKGTAARCDDPTRDAERARALLDSAKDLAELVMIVDLERNDLGRVARPGGVRVEGYPSLASYARVHHLMADVVAEPRPGIDAVDLLWALFPGGSVTGAPKLRSMQLIGELEGEGRGHFCGAMGFLDTRGRCAFNLLIRTFLWRPRDGAGRGEVSFRVGGGITWSSDAHAEDRETLDKAAGMIAAVFGPDGAVAQAGGPPSGAAPGPGRGTRVSNT